MSARRLAGALMLALFVFVLAWQLRLAPPEALPRALAAALHAAPLLPGLLLLLLGRRSATFWGAIAALVLFCHGISEAWSSPAVRTLAALETALSVGLIVAASWDGLRARFARRRGV